MKLLMHKEHRLITVVGVIIVVSTVIFALITINPWELESGLIAIFLHLLTVSLILILTGVFVEVLHRLNEEKQHLIETERLIEQKLNQKGQMFAPHEEAEIRALIKKKVKPVRKAAKKKKK